MKKRLISELLSVCATPLAWAGNLSEQVIKQPDQQWDFQHLTAISNESISCVSGRLTSNQRFGLPLWHIDIAAYQPSAKLIAETTTDDVPAVIYANSLEG